MKKISIRIRASIVMAAIGLVRFVQSHFWEDVAHQNAHALEGAAEWFLGAWFLAMAHLVLTSDAWRNRKKN
ncbi:hypothetical protein [Streptomyces sp. AC555_RSS877]|uniref:hypothetical protein n=1 Tax=Streptomyces sp. AC555_RSS877 TaxID=2823688 RepID=UPI001C25EFD5|nr:hypothetical protein [Streptomyces sp. AC555_RSS877]